MKKFLPVILIFLVSISFVEYRDFFAKQAKLSKQITSHYESAFLSSTFTNLKNEKLDFSKLDSKIIIVNFWASWCRPCIAEFKSLVELQSRFDKKEIRIIAINSDEENQEKIVKKMIKEHSLNFDIVLDKDSKALTKYKISAIPVSIIYHKGKVVEVSNGAKDFSSIESVLTYKSYLKK